jgi:hypothetical protein
VNNEEDQLLWSTEVSSCDSSERGERGPEAALVEGGDFGDTVSDGSEPNYQEVSAKGKAMQGCLVDNSNFEVVPQDSFSKTGDGNPNSSKVHAKKTKLGANGCDVLDEV